MTLFGLVTQQSTLAKKSKELEANFICGPSTSPLLSHVHVLPLIQVWNMCQNDYTLNHAWRNGQKNSNYLYHHLSGEKEEEEEEVGNKNLQMNSYSYYQERKDLFLPKNRNSAFIFAIGTCPRKKYQVFLCSFIFYFLCDPSKHNVLPN